MPPRGKSGELTVAEVVTWKYQGQSWQAKIEAEGRMYVLSEMVHEGMYEHYVRYIPGKSGHGTKQVLVPHPDRIKWVRNPLELAKTQLRLLRLLRRNGVKYGLSGTMLRYLHVNGE